MRLSRRRVLVGAGACVALPALEAFGAPLGPARLITVFSPNGTVVDDWNAAPSAGAALPPVLEPLEPFAGALTQVVDLDMVAAMRSPGSGHQNGIVALWTGWPGEASTLFQRIGWALGPSVDQVAAPVLGRGARLPSLELGVQVFGSGIFDRMVYRAAGQPLPPLTSPREVFERLFGADVANTPEAQRRRARRQSVLDAVLGEYAALSREVSATDRRRLDAHATAIRELELQLDTVNHPGPGCVVPHSPTEPSLTQPTSYPELLRLQRELLVLALACDVTRVASLQLSCAASPVVFSWLGHARDHHELSHRFGERGVREELFGITRWYASQLAALLGALAATPDVGGGTLLDRTLVVWGNEMGAGDHHDYASTPFVVAGGRRLGFRHAPRFDARHAPHNRLLGTCLTALGVKVSGFGDLTIDSAPFTPLLVG